MRLFLKDIRLGTAALAAAMMLAGALPSTIALAQTAPPAATATALSEPTVKALQEALVKQGIAVKADGVLSDETRAAIRKYQSQHHLPVTGEPDKATLDKLGVANRQSAAPNDQALQNPTSTTGQSQSTPTAQPQPGPTPGMMMSGPMMQGSMQGMMQMMQGMMQMMQGQMQPGQMQTDSMRPGPAQGRMMANCPMTQTSTQGMMQMMQGMMQMMLMMQGQMRPDAR